MPAKICKICNKDCSTKPRTKDLQGNYYCNQCLDARKTGDPDRVPSRAVLSGSAEPSTDLADVVDADFAAELASLRDVEAATPAQVPQAAAAPGCPSCGKTVPPGAAICMGCGYNLKTGRQLDTRIGKPKVPVGDTAAGKVALGSASLVVWLVSGGIAAAICLAGWIAVAYYGNVEIGWLALLAGAIIGGAIAATGQSRLNALSGLIAAGYTFFAVAGWKVVIYQLLKDKIQIDEGEMFKEIAFGLIFALVGCGIAFKVGSTGFSALSSD